MTFELSVLEDDSAGLFNLGNLSKDDKVLAGVGGHDFKVRITCSAVWKDAGINKLLSVSVILLMKNICKVSYHIGSILIIFMIWRARENQGDIQSFLFWFNFNITS